MIESREELERKLQHVTEQREKYRGADDDEMYTWACVRMAHYLAEIEKGRLEGRWTE